MWDDWRRTRQPFRNQDAGGAFEGWPPAECGSLAANSSSIPGQKASGWALGGGPALYLFSRSRSRCRNSSMSLHSSASSKSRSRSASRACCTSNSLVFSMGKGPRLQGAALFICQTGKSCGPEKNAVCRSGSAVRPMEDSRHDCESQLCVVCLTGGKHGGGFCPRAEKTAVFCPGRGGAGK